MRISDWSSDVCSSDLRANLRRVVAVIVDHRHRAAVDRHLAYLGEATLDPAEPGKALPDLRIVDAEFERDPDRGERVLDVVAPRHRQLDPVDRAYIAVARSEEHTSELQSLMRIASAVFCLKT